MKEQTNKGSGGVHPSKLINHGNTASNNDHMKSGCTTPTNPKGPAPEQSGRSGGGGSSDSSAKWPAVKP